MKSCIYCGNPLEDQAQFCNVCGQRQYQSQQPQPTYGQNPCYAQPHYNLVSQAPFKAPVWMIGLFTILGAVVVYLLRMVINTLIYSLGWGTPSNLISLLFSGCCTVIYVLIVVVGFVIYNNKCKSSGHKEKKLSILWAGLPWLLRTVFDFIINVILGLVFPILIYDMGLTARTVAIVNTVVNFVIVLLNILITWLLTMVILKSVVRDR